MLGTSLGEGNGNPLQYSCLENPADRGAWWTAVFGVTQSQTRLKRLSSSSSSSSRDLPGGSVVKTLCSQCRGPRFNLCSGKLIPYTTQSSHAATKDPVYRNEDLRFCVPQLRPRAANIKKYFKNKVFGKILKNSFLPISDFDIAGAGLSTTKTNTETSIMYHLSRRQFHRIMITLDPLDS